MKLGGFWSPCVRWITTFNYNSHPLSLELMTFKRNGIKIKFYHIIGQIFQKRGPFHLHSDLQNKTQRCSSEAKHEVYIFEKETEDK